MTEYTIADRYLLQDELGAGGMGTVYRGVDTRTNTTVAIKQLKPELTDPEQIERFKREGEALRELNHPNIVKMLNAVQANGNHYLVMEYVSGGDLRGLIQQQGKLDYQRCVDLAIDLADALTRAHRLNIIHRDLKPANVLIGEDGVLRLTDFGVAHVGSKERVTKTDAIIGTVDYIPPEALHGESTDHRADIWAFGVMLFEMLTGKRPFMGDSLGAIVTAILTAPLADLEALAPDTPLTLVDLVYRMLERDLHARIASVRHVGAVLEDILQGRATAPLLTRFETPISDFQFRPKHNLPAQTTPFVGREHELGELDKLIRDPNIRLITVLAPGGMGKTRLSLEVAERAFPDFDDGVYIVELAPLSDPNNIITAIAEAIGYQFQGDGREPKQQVLDFLEHKSLLLVMDNFEHLLDGASLVTEILNHAPDVQILATSRQRLNQHGEALFHLSGMDFPAWETPEDALEYAAVKLFMNSAKRARPDFELKADNLDYVARICRLVQGMPLGIVLSASWLGMLSPEEIADEIAQGIDFLATDETELPERQRSIRAVMDYSWMQMTEPEQDVFMKLSVFRGGFTREAGEAVASANLRVLMSLVNKSLLHRNAESGRYQIHELLRQYGEAQLQADAIAYNQVQATHSTYFAKYVARVFENFPYHPDPKTLYDMLETDLQNVQIGWGWAVRNLNHTNLWAYMGGLWEFYFNRVYLDEGYRCWTDVIHVLEVKDKVGQHEELLACFLSAHAWFCIVLGRMEEAQFSYRRGLELFNKYDLITIRWEALFAYCTLGYSLAFKQPEEARYIIENTVTTLQKRGEFKYPMIWALSLLGFLEAGFFQNVARAKVLLEEALDLSRRIHSLQGIAICTQYLAEIVYREGDHSRAKPLLQEAHLSLTKIGDKWNALRLVPLIIGSTLTEGALDEAQKYTRQMFPFLKQINSGQATAQSNIVWSMLIAIVHLQIAQGKHQAATQLLGVLVTYYPNHVHHTTDLLKTLETTLGNDAYHVIFEHGKTLSMEAIIQELAEQFAYKQ